jgi:hypothetical protein
MRRVLLILIILSVPFISDAQYKWDIGFKTGAANYLGDIGGGKGTRRNFVADMKLGETRGAGGIFARYKLLPKVSIQGGFDYGHIQGDDKLSANPARNHRNLNFSNNIFELNVMGQYCFYEINDLGHAYTYRNGFKAYAGIGIAGFHHNPKTLDGGVALQPLETENVNYSLFQFSIPAQLGFYFTVNKRYRLGWDITWRTTFTDYLDDVSSKYPNPKDIGPIAWSYSNRSNSLPITQADKNNYMPGSKRGDASHKDSYILTTFNFSYALRGKSTFYKSHYGSVFKGKKYKKRKFRAKF